MRALSALVSDIKATKPASTSSVLAAVDTLRPRLINERFSQVFIFQLQQSKSVEHAGRITGVVRGTFLIPSYIGIVVQT